MWETWVRSLGQEDPLEEGMATHSTILSRRTPMDRGARSRGPWGRKESGEAGRLAGHSLKRAVQ